MPSGDFPAVRHDGLPWISSQAFLPIGFCTFGRPLCPHCNQVAWQPHWCIEGIEAHAAEKLAESIKYLEDRGYTVTPPPPTRKPS